VLTALAAVVLTALIAWTAMSIVLMANRGPEVVRQAALADHHARASSDAMQDFRAMLAETSGGQLRRTVDTFIADSTDYKNLDIFAAECMRREMFPQAVKLYGASFKQAKAQLGLASPSTIRAIQLFAEALTKNKQLEHAEDFLASTLASDAIGYNFEPRIDETRVPSAIYSTTLRLGWTLAEIHRRQGLIAQAEGEYRIVLADQFRMYRDRTDWLDTLDNLVYLLVNEDRQAEARTVIRQYLEHEYFDESSASDDQIKTIDTIRNRIAPKDPVYYSLAATGNATGLR